MTAFFLKLIAVISMLIDHSGILLRKHELIGRDLYIFMRTMGRFAFPIYAFLLAEGFRHLREDSKRIQKHLLLLFALTAVSEIPFDFLDHGVIRYAEGQSVMFTLTIAFLGLWLSDLYRERILLRGGIWLLAMALSVLIHTDYGSAGVLLVFASSVYLERCETWDYGRRFLGVLCVMCLYYGYYMWVGSGFGTPAAAWNRFVAMDVYNIPHLILVPILAAYRGELGLRNRVLHRCYQWYYPAHLAVLCLVGLLLGK